MNSRKTTLGTLVIGAVLVLAGPVGTFAASYSYTMIADTSDGQFQGFTTLPSINSEGTVAFIDSTGNFLLRGNGNAVDILYQEGDGILLGFGGHPSINDSGRVAFIANSSLGGGVFSGDGGAVTVITIGGGFSNVSMNAEGIVAFHSANVGIFTGSGGAITTIVDANGPFTINSFAEPSINNAGVVAFHGGLKTGGFGIFTGNGTNLMTIADSNGPLDFDGNFGRIPSINNEGTVAFLAKLDDGGVGVFTATNGTITRIADSTGPFSGFDQQGPSIDSRGTVAFHGFLDDGGEGIFIGPNPTTDKVIGIGDTLFGKTIDFLGFGWRGLNDKGEVAFFAKTGDRSGIYRATPINKPPVCTTAQAIPTILWSPDHQFVPIVVMGVTDPDGDSVTITVTSVTQDEPVNAKGDGNTSPDAVIQSSSASIRAERSGKGDGRVYQLSFRAEDGKGGSCTGAVTVSVPHSMKKGLTAIDDGQVYDSTIP